MANTKRKGAYIRYVAEIFSVLLDNGTGIIIKKCTFMGMCIKNLHSWMHM